MTFFSNNAPLLLLLGLLTAIIVILLPAPVSITNGLKVQECSRLALSFTSEFLDYWLG